MLNTSISSFCSILNCLAVNGCSLIVSMKKWCSLSFPSPVKFFIYLALLSTITYFFSFQLLFLILCFYRSFGLCYVTELHHFFFVRCWLVHCNLTVNGFVQLFLILLKLEILSMVYSLNIKSADLLGSICYLLLYYF